MAKISQTVTQSELATLTVATSASNSEQISLDPGYVPLTPEQYMEARVRDIIDGYAALQNEVSANPTIKKIRKADPATLAQIISFVDSKIP
jgi:hypothetical protein